MEKSDSLKDIDELKIKYDEFKGKYDLPEFDALSEDFDIEKIVEKESSYILREIRRAMNEKLTAYLHLFENLIGPSSPPMFVFSILKNSSVEDKEKMKEIYKELAKFQIKTMKLDTLYDEKEESEFIHLVFDKWQKIKVDINSLIEGFEEKFEENNLGNHSGYFG